MQFVVTKQIAVEAETPEEAVAKTLTGEGKTISIGAAFRPQPTVMPQKIKPTTP